MGVNYIKVKVTVVGGPYDESTIVMDLPKYRMEADFIDTDVMQSAVVLGYRDADQPPLEVTVFHGPSVIRLPVLLQEDGHYVVQWPVRPEHPFYCPQCARQPKLADFDDDKKIYSVECIMGHQWKFPYKMLARYRPNTWPTAVKALR